MAEKRRYPDALIFNAWPNPPDRFDIPDHTPESVQRQVDALEACDPELQYNRRLARGNGNSIPLVGPWD